VPWIDAPGPGECLVLPGTPLYGTVRVDAWRGVHPLIHGDRGYFAGWDGALPVLRGTLLHVTVDHLPGGREPRKAMWLWQAGPGPLSPDELWRAYLARFDEEHAFKFAKGTLGLTAAKVRTPSRPAGGPAWSWPRTPSCCSPGPSPRTCAAPGKNARTPPVPSRPGGSAAGLQTSGLSRLCRLFPVVSQPCAELVLTPSTARHADYPGQGARERASAESGGATETVLMPGEERSIADLFPRLAAGTCTRGVPAVRERYYPSYLRTAMGELMPFGGKYSEIA